MAVGGRRKVENLKQQLAKRFTVKSKVIGSGNGGGELQETRVLDRIVRWTTAGWEYEADQRHAELIVKGLGLEEAKAVATPAEGERPRLAEEDEEKLGSQEAREFRGLAARANYLALDRIDIQYAVKELVKDMSKPKVSSWAALMRLEIIPKEDQYVQSISHTSLPHR